MATYQDLMDELDKTEQTARRAATAIRSGLSLAGSGGSGGPDFQAAVDRLASLRNQLAGALDALPAPGSDAATATPIVPGSPLPADVVVAPGELGQPPAQSPPSPTVPGGVVEPQPATAIEPPKPPSDPAFDPGSGA